MTIRRAERRRSKRGACALLVLAAGAVALGCAVGGSGRRDDTRRRYVEDGRASYYAPRFAGRRTASGEIYDPSSLTAAHRTLPFGTIIRVTAASGASVTVRVNDRCGCPAGRIVDLSAEAARRLGMLRAGVVPVRLEVIGD